MKMKKPALSASILLLALFSASASAQYNTATGQYTLTNNTSGYQNTATGYGALYFNTTGYNNTGTGFQALFLNTTGFQNTATGASSLPNNTTGSYNTATGGGALYSNTSASRHSAHGFDALYYNTTGTDNTATGYGALASNSKGYGNTAHGVTAFFSNTGGFFCVASGFGALYLGPGTINNIGIGSQALAGGAEGGGNVGMGNFALGNNDYYGSNVAIGNFALYAAAGSFNTAIGNSADVASVHNSTAIGAGAIVTASNTVRIGDTNVTQIGGQVAWSTLSDARAKKDIRDITLGYDFIKALRPVEFRMLDGNDRIDLGFVAQDIETLLGQGHNIVSVGGGSQRNLSVRYTDLIAPIVKALQEQRQINVELRRVRQSTMGELQRELQELKALLSHAGSR